MWNQLLGTTKSKLYPMILLRARFIERMKINRYVISQFIFFVLINKDGKLFWERRVEGFPPGHRYQKWRNHYNRLKWHSLEDLREKHPYRLIIDFDSSDLIEFKEEHLNSCELR